MERNGRFQEWNGRQSSILPYRTNSMLDFVYSKIHIDVGNDKKDCHRSIQLQYQRILFVDKLRYFGCVLCANSVRIASL